MTIQQFLHPNELWGLSDVDPEVAFAAIIQKAKVSLDEQSIGLSLQVDEEARELTNLQCNLMRALIACARSLKVLPFADMKLPRRGAFDADTFENFLDELELFAARVTMKRVAARIEMPAGAGAPVRPDVRQGRRGYHFSDDVPFAPSL